MSWTNDAAGSWADASHDVRDDLAHLAAEATLMDLPTVEFQVDALRPISWFAREMEARADAPAAIVLRRGALVGIVTRLALFQYLSTMPTSRESIIELADLVTPHVLLLPETTTVEEAAQAALNRPAAYAYDPILVENRFGGLNMVDTQILLLAQSRLLQLSNRIIKQQKEAAEIAAATKTQVLATMSHEIRTPMNAVIGMAGLILETTLTEEQGEYARVIRESGESLLNILNDILDYSKIEAGRVELEEQPFLVRDCVEGAAEILAARAAEKNLDLVVNIGRDVPAALLGDTTRVRQVLVNLISNAVKFTNRGEVEVRVTAIPVHEPQYEIEFAVRDTGIGIPADKIERLFQSYSQVDASTTRRYGGTGLGLAISKRLSEMMGGVIRVASAPGEGSTFYFTLPAEVAAMPGSHFEDDNLPLLSGKRALVIEDNRVSCEVLASQLRAWSMAVEQASSLPEALTLLAEETRFDVVLLDTGIGRNENAGQDIIDAAHGAGIPLFALSSLGEHSLQRQPTAHYAAVLLRPVRQSTLYNQLITLFTSSEGTQQRMRKPSTFDTTMGRNLPLRILLAEDMPINQQLMVAMLNKLGYQPDVACNGMEVLEAMGRKEYDVILMDIQMPEMDGMEAAQRIITNWPPERRPRIVALTANVMPEDREQYAATGMQDYLAKPVCTSQLQEMLRRCTPRVNCAPAEPDPEVPVQTARLDELRQLAEFGAPTIQELAEMLRQDGGALMARARSENAAGNLDELKRAAHSLKGIAGSLGASALADLCWRLQQTSQVGLPADGLLVALEDEFNKVCEALKRAV